jgi:hypothetical protein
MGDIIYSFSENSEANTANGWFNVESDEYDLFLRVSPFHGLSGDEKQVSPETAARLLWEEFLSQAGVSYA